MILNMIYRFKWWGQWGVRIVPTRINVYTRGAVRECVSGQTDCSKTPNEYASSGYIVRGIEMRPTYFRNPNLCDLLCCPVPCQVDGTHVLCITASAALPYCWVYFVYSEVLFFSFIIVVIIFVPLSLPSLGSLVSSLPHERDRFFFFFFRAL